MSNGPQASNTPPGLPEHVLFGAAYYPEYSPDRSVGTDLDLMAEAGMNVVRVGESVWSTWEPEDGRFELDWLQEVFDGCQARNMSVILGTPTYAVPLWLARKHPDIAAEQPDGRRQPWGGRQDMDLTHPAYRFHAERVIRAVVGRYASHPALIGYQVDNEPGLRLLHNPGVVEAFTEELRKTYGDVGTINEAWGLAHWSHALSDWDDLWAPHGNLHPQYDQAWRAFQTRLVNDFIAWQAGIVRDVASAAGRDDQFVMTCVAYDVPAVDEVAVNRPLDVAGGNPYYPMQDHLALPAPAELPDTAWMVTGTWNLVHLADRMYASKQAPFLVTETNAGATGDSSVNLPAWDGQWRQVAWALVARGARMIEYWQWHSMHTGIEMHYAGVLPHDLRPGRVYEEVARIGTELKRAGASVADLRPDADVGLMYSVPSKWALAFQPPWTPSGPYSFFARVERAYDRMVGTWARGAFDAAVSTRIIHERQVVLDGDGPAENLADPAALARELPVLLVPALYAASDLLLDWLTAYAETGGHLVIGVRTGYADEFARARPDVKPGRLSAAAGVSYQESSNLASPVPLRRAATEPIGIPALELPEGATGKAWIDCLKVLDADGEQSAAEVLASYQHPHFGKFPAVTTRAYGEGRITVAGTEPDAATGAALVDWAVRVSGAARPERAAIAVRRWGGPESVRVSSASAQDGTRIHVVHNWSWEPAKVTVPATMRDLLSSRTHAGADHVDLGPWDVHVLAETGDAESR
ncbi:beta-galactosidase [Streptomyces sp. SID13726]|uniref:beta-galactosidase n=1 Tax=Streptomyces sp. SID13726 TaxID=2706058 RepID=UPI0013BC7322|nr:beta-galactosidase [Streptomyces sp. SID13726]NEB03476.1 beta-galactosidase [Streptomyces sp. SID13726]